MKRILPMLLVILSLILMGCHNKNIDAAKTETISFGNEANENTANDDDMNSCQKYPSHMPTEPYWLVGLSDISIVNGVVGNWRWENGVLTATNKDTGNCFALTDIYAVAGVTPAVTNPQKN